MFIKNYAPNRCEPSIEALNFGGGGGGGGGGRGGLKNIQKKKWGVSGRGVGLGGGGGVRVDLNGEVKFL